MSASKFVMTTAETVYNKALGIFGSKLSRYIMKKVINAFLTFFVALTIVFFLYHALPGSAANVFAQDPRISEETRARISEQFGLDQPLHVQYWLFLKNLARGDLGISFLHRVPVMDLLWESLPWTLLLLGTSFIIGAVIGILFGAYVAWRRATKLDTSFVLLYNVYNAFPLFFVGMLFVGIFGYQARIKGWGFYFPLFGAQDPVVRANGTWWEVVLDTLHHMVLPFSVLVLFSIFAWSWFVRGNLISILSEDYIMTAKAKGLTDNQVLYDHGMRNAMLPVVTAIGLDFGALIGGNVLIETVFSYPGTGFLLFDSLLKKDYPVVQGAFILIAALTLGGLLITDIMYGFIDPRVRTE